MNWSCYYDYSQYLDFYKEVERTALLALSVIASSLVAYLALLKHCEID